MARFGTLTLAAVFILGACSSNSGGGTSDSEARAVFCQHLTALQGIDQGIASGEFTGQQGITLLQQAVSSLRSDASAFDQAADSDLARTATALADDLDEAARDLQAGNDQSAADAVNRTTGIIQTLPAC